jgi:hypothetical protein
MSYHGLPCWYELATTDTTAAAAFYGKVLGWTWIAAPVPGMTYHLASAGPTQVAGMMATEASGQPVAWTFYVAVDNCDTTAALAQTPGAKLIVPPADIPGTGRFSVLIDPQGAALAVLQPLPGGTGSAFDQAKPSHGNWHDLEAPDPKAALAFYGKLFGWTVSRALKMGPDMTYHIIAVGGQDIGGIFNNGSAVGWKPYFGVPSIKAGLAATKAAGGTVLRGPDEVPGGAFTAIATDPQGARFAMTGPA